MENESFSQLSEASSATKSYGYQASPKLYQYCFDNDFDDIIDRVRTHPREARFVDEGGYFPLHWLASWKAAPLDVVKAVYIAYPTALKRKNKLGDTPLHIATNVQSSKSGEVINFLRESKKKIKHDSVNGRDFTSLHWIAVHRAPLHAVMTVYTANPKDLFIKTRFGDTAYDLAVLCDAPLDVISFLRDSALKQGDLREVSCNSTKDVKMVNTRHAAFSKMRKSRQITSCDNIEIYLEDSRKHERNKSFDDLESLQTDSKLHEDKTLLARKVSELETICDNGIYVMNALKDRVSDGDTNQKKLSNRITRLEEKLRRADEDKAKTKRQVDCQIKNMCRQLRGAQEKIRKAEQEKNSMEKKLANMQTLHYVEGREITNKINNWNHLKYKQNEGQPHIVENVHDKTHDALKACTDEDDTIVYNSNWQRRLNTCTSCDEITEKLEILMIANANLRQELSELKN